MPSLYQFVKYFECRPDTMHKEPLDTFRHTVHAFLLETLLWHLGGKFLDRKEVWFCFTFFPSEVPQRSVNSYTVNPSGTEGHFGKGI